MTEEWEKLNEEEGARILSEVNEHIEPVPFGFGTTSVRKQKLSFYKNYDLYELTDMSTVPAVRKYVIYAPGYVRLINWTNEPIYETNEKADFDLNENTVIDYIKFFFSYVRGRHGRFMIVEKVDDIRWQNEPPAQGRKAVQEMLEPMFVHSQDTNGTYNLRTYMIFKDSLFRTEVHVENTGQVTLSDEELKIEGMPVIPDAVSA